MAPTVSRGSQAATVTTEHTLFDSSAGGTYRCGVDASVMADGDVLELRVYKMYKTSGTRRVIQKAILRDAQAADDAGVMFVPESTDLSDSGAIRFTLKQIKGTTRTYDWEVQNFG